MLAGLSRATRGEGEAATELCEHALEVSPDSFETAFILVCLGKARAEAGNVAGAVAALKQGVELADQVRSLQFRAWFRTILAEAHLLNNEIDDAAIVVGEALKASEKVDFLIGVGLSEQVLGKLALARKNFGEAKQHLETAANIFARLGARFELARTCLELANTCHATGNRPAATSKLGQARMLFIELATPRYVERADALRNSLGYPSRTSSSEKLG
jgi:tetratricopeptide (TPR) repeat protein